MACLFAIFVLNSFIHTALTHVGGPAHECFLVKTIVILRAAKRIVIYCAHLNKRIVLEIKK